MNNPTGNDLRRFTPEEKAKLMDFLLLGLGEAIHRVDCPITGDTIFYTIIT